VRATMYAKAPVDAPVATPASPAQSGGKRVA